jgi:hypothetical protein
LAVTPCDCYRIDSKQLLPHLHSRTPTKIPHVALLALDPRYFCVNLTRHSELQETLLMNETYDATAYDLIGRVLSRKGQAPESVFDFEKAT